MARGIVACVVGPQEEWIALQGIEVSRDMEGTQVLRIRCCVRVHYTFVSVFSVTIWLISTY
jgi:hypothetical protein